MSKISEYLSNILSSIYGKDVRQSIHDAIEQCYEDVTNGVTKSETAAANAQSVVETVNKAAQNADAKANIAVESSQSALRAAEEARTSASNADAKAALAQKAASDVTSSVNKADAWGNATVTVEAIPPDGAADVEVTRVSDQPNNIHFFLPRGSSGVVTSDTEPTDPDVTVWIKPGDDPDPDIVQQVSQLKDTKANVIIDSNPKAASHTIHPQDGRLAVTLYGQTTETGTGDKSPDNPYEISGVGEAKAYVFGKNMINPTACVNGFLYMDLSNGIASASDSRKEKTTEYIPIAEGKTYTLTAEVPSGSEAWVAVGFYDASKNNIGLRIATTGTANVASQTSTAPSGARYIRCSFRTYRNATAQLEAGSVATAYEPYNANVIAPPLLPDGAPLHGNGTVYDTIENDVLSGCDVKLVFNGSDGWKTSSVSGVLRYELPKKLYRDNPALISCNLFAVGRVTDIKNSAVNKLSYHYQADVIYVNIPGITTLAQLDDYFAANPLMVSYRSTEYTTDKDLRVCRVVRKWNTVMLDGSSDETYTEGATTVSGVKRFLVGAIADCMPANTNYAVGNIVCDRLDTMAIQYGTYAGVQSIGVDSSKRVYICFDGVADEAGLRVLLAAKPLEVTYQLDTPETYMTDPLPLRKPDGMEVVTVTGSGETAVTYPHDTKDWGKNAASAMIGMGESSMTATKNYAIGEFIVDKNTLTLYRATTAIANGEAIVPGTNCTATTVVEQLSAIYAMLNT